MESTRGIRTLVVVFELLEEMVAWGCRNGRFNEKFQILPLELKVKFIRMLSYVFLTVLDLPPRFISATFHVDKSLKMAAKLGDCRKLGKFKELGSIHNLPRGWAMMILRWGSLFFPTMI